MQIVNLVVGLIAGLVNTVVVFSRVALVVVLVVVGVCAYDLSSKEAVPTAVKLAGYDEQGLATKAAMRVMMMAQPKWTVSNCLLFRVASTGDSEKDLKLVQLPFTNGSWYKL